MDGLVRPPDASDEIRRVGTRRPDLPASVTETLPRTDEPSKDGDYGSKSFRNNLDDPGFPSVALSLRREQEPFGVRVTPHSVHGGPSPAFSVLSPEGRHLSLKYHFHYSLTRTTLLPNMYTCRSPLLHLSSSFLVGETRGYPTFWCVSMDRPRGCDLLRRRVARSGSRTGFQ